jgi:hypothetical protein
MSVELPYESNRPHPKTGLKDRSTVVCNWWKKVPLSSIQEYAGVVPGKQLLEILRKVKTLLSSQGDAED